MLVGRPHQLEARIADQTGARIADKRRVEAAFELSNNGVFHLRFVVLVKCGDAGSDPETLQETGAMTGILGQNHVHGPKHFDGTVGNVVQVTDGRGNDEKTTG